MGLNELVVVQILDDLKQVVGVFYGIRVLEVDSEYGNGIVVWICFVGEVVSGNGDWIGQDFVVIGCELFYGFFKCVWVGEMNGWVGVFWGWFIGIEMIGNVGSVFGDWEYGKRIGFYICDKFQFCFEDSVVEIDCFVQIGDWDFYLNIKVLWGECYWEIFLVM